MKMYEVKQSDDGIIPMRAANKGAQAPAELTEGRTSTKGNPQVLRDNQDCTVATIRIALWVSLIVRRYRHI